MTTNRQLTLSCLIVYCFPLPPFFANKYAIRSVVPKICVYIIFSLVTIISILNHCHLYIVKSNILVCKIFGDIFARRLMCPHVKKTLLCTQSVCATDKNTRLIWLLAYTLCKIKRDFVHLLRNVSQRDILYCL